MADNSTGARERLELPSPVTNVEDGKGALDEYWIAIHRGALSADQVEALKALGKEALFEVSREPRQYMEPDERAKNFWNVCHSATRWWPPISGVIAGCAAPANPSVANTSCRFESKTG